MLLKLHGSLERVEEASIILWWCLSFTCVSLFVSWLSSISTKGNGLPLWPGTDRYICEHLSTQSAALSLALLLPARPFLFLSLFLFIPPRAQLHTTLHLLPESNHFPLSHCWARWEVRLTSASSVLHSIFISVGALLMETTWINLLFFIRPLSLCFLLQWIYTSYRLQWYFCRVISSLFLTKQLAFTPTQIAFFHGPDFLLPPSLNVTPEQRPLNKQTALQRETSREREREELLFFVQNTFLPPSNSLEEPFPIIHNRRMYYKNKQSSLRAVTQLNLSWPLEE